MLRLGERYQHFVHGAGCGCSSPELQQASRRLEEYTRRGFLSGMAATLIAAGTPLGAFAQTAGPSPKVLFRQLKLFDGKSDTARTDVQVLVEGNKIASIDTTNSPPPSDATIIDCGDRVLMPGLIDAHWHTLFAAVPVALATTG